MADRHGARPGRSCRRAPSPGDGIETYATKHAIRPEPPAARRRHRRENPDFSMGPEVPLEKVKATRVELDTCIMDVQATNRTLTKQIDDRELRQAGQRVCGAGAQGPGLLRSRFHAARGSARRDGRRGGRALPIPGARGACRSDIGRGRGGAARCRAAVETPSSRRKGRGTASRATPHGRPGWAVPGWHPAPRRSCSHKGACSRNRNSLERLLIQIDVPDAQPAYSMSRNPEPHKRLAITQRTPSKRARTDRSSSPVNTIGRLPGFLARWTPTSRPNPLCP
jgi:hypothetical protein